MANKYLDRITELEWIVKEQDRAIKFLKEWIWERTYALRKEIERLDDLIDFY